VERLTEGLRRTGDAGVREDYGTRHCSLGRFAGVGAARGAEPVPGIEVDTGGLDRAAHRSRRRVGLLPVPQITAAVGVFAIGWRGRAIPSTSPEGRPSAIVEITYRRTGASCRWRRRTPDRGRSDRRKP